MMIGVLNRAVNSEPILTPVSAMLGADDDQPTVGIDHGGHGDADGRQVVGRNAALADHVVHALFDGGHDPFRPPLAAWGTFRGR